MTILIHAGKEIPKGYTGYGQSSPEMTQTMEGWFSEDVHALLFLKDPTNTERYTQFIGLIPKHIFVAFTWNAGNEIWIGEFKTTNGVWYTFRMNPADTISCDFHQWRSLKRGELVTLKSDSHIELEHKRPIYKTVSHVDSHDMIWLEIDPFHHRREIFHINEMTVVQDFVLDKVGNEKQNK